ncbi:MAG TPA: DUF4199 domain-containing protein [Vicinamibacterales bacterium]
MKRTVLVFGLLSGVVSAAMMLLTMPFIDEIGFDRGMIVGYTAIVLSFLFVFFGIRSYREAHGGTISFGRGFAVGILITLISCLFYVATWELAKDRLAPGFVDKYSAYAIEQKKASGASAEEVEAVRQQLEQFKVWYANPFMSAAMTFTEPFPVGLLVTLISAGVLRKKPAGAVART